MLHLVKSGCVLLAVWLTAFQPAQASDRCGMYPADIAERTYAGFSGCLLKDVGEKPLWKGVTDGKYRQQIRLTFTQGHMLFTRVINFAELQDGTGTISIRTIYTGYRKPRKISKVKRIKLWADDVAKINALGEESGVWKFPHGTWDNPEEIYLHCQTLDMERADMEGYRYSMVNIGCNQPKKLMLFVDHITKLVGLEPTHNGQLY